MKSVNDERFLELAMKRIAGQAGAAEGVELDEVLAGQAERREEFDRLAMQARLARTVLPLTEAVHASSPTLPGYARERLRTKVRQTLRPSDAAARERVDRTSLVFAGWRWVLGLVGAAVVLAIVLVPRLSDFREPVIQIAVYDPSGPTRGGATNDAAIVQKLWPSGSLREFSDLPDLQAWFGPHQASARRAVVQIVYDRPAAEIRVVVRQGERVAETSIPVETDLRLAWGKAGEFAETALRAR